MIMPGKGRGSSIQSGDGRTAKDVFAPLDSVVQHLSTSWALDGISFPLVMLTSFVTHAVDGGQLADRQARQSLLHFVPAARDGHAGRVSGARLLPVLRVLGSHAVADVLPDRRVGWPAPRICRHQVLPVHAAGQRVHADRHSDAVLLQRSGAARPTANSSPRSVVVVTSEHERRRQQAERRSTAETAPNTRSTSWPCSKWASTPSCSTAVAAGARALQWWAFLLLFIGFVIKVPSVPVHTWLPDAHVEAPTPISMILAGVLLKMGGYGILRICYPICPARGLRLGLAVVCGLGVVSMVYGAFAALAQKDFKRLVAYSSVSHMGYVLLGIGVWSAVAGNQFDPDYWKMGMNGAMFQMIAHGISSPGMFFMVGVIYDRVHHRNLDQFGGLFAKMPVYSRSGDRHFLCRLGPARLVRIHRRSFRDLVGVEFQPWRWPSFRPRW